MKRLLILFTILLTVFMGVWVFKSKTPANRPEDIVDGNQYMAWWDRNDSEPAVNTDWVLDPEIPENYIPVPGEDELYMVIDEYGMIIEYSMIIEYRHRTQQEDGTWVWETVNPDIPDNYEAVEGLENVYKVTNQDGTISYYKYIRNDDTFAFVPVDEYGNPLNNTTPTGSEIPDNYIRISGNIYAVYNEHGVIIGYKERKLDENGNYYWVDAAKPKTTNNSSGLESSNNGNLYIPDVSVNTGTGNGNESGNNSNANHTSGLTNNAGQVIYGSDGTYTQTETIISTETTGGRVITYQTVITKTYSSTGELISTKKDGPTEISKVKASNGDGAVPDKSKIASTLSAEFARVSVGLSYNSSLANSVLAEINAERTAAGNASLTLSTTTDVYRLAAIRAADMAIYNHTDYDSAMYGTLAAMCNKFVFQQVRLLRYYGKHRLINLHRQLLLVSSK